MGGSRDQDRINNYTNFAIEMELLEEEMNPFTKLPKT